MSVYQRKLSNGRRAKKFNYEFEHNGQRFRGSTGATTEKDALQFERKYIAKLRMQTSAKGVVENFRDALVGGQRVKLTKAFSRFTQKPRKKALSPASLQDKTTVWQDFLAFLTAMHPAARTLNDVTIGMAEEYTNHLSQHGKFAKDVTFTSGDRKVEYQRAGSLSPRTVCLYVATLKEIFGKLEVDSSLDRNPFASVVKPKLNTVKREAFTPEELKLIAEKATPFVYAIFMIGSHTGMREGDICCLRWAEVDLEKGWIERQTNKTGKTVRIPILAGLRPWLSKLPRDGEYVLPEHAALYLSNPVGVTWRVRECLHGMGIVTTRVPPGRTQAVSIKDVHSLRHTFCAVAAAAGVPLPVVQSIVGHVTEAMTIHYAAHTTDAQKLGTMSALPQLFGASPSEEEQVLEEARARVIETARSANLWQLQSMLEAAKTESVTGTRFQ